MTSKPDKEACFAVTISELVELLSKSVEAMSPIEKAELRAAMQGRLSSQTSERLQ